MATYLQGVTDYIPDYQPFQPDLNFYNNYLQTKQSQYDSNWKSLNNLYGQYFYADLTRESNIKKKDDLLKQIDFNLNRIAGLDLSLEQNVTQATQIFTPFYEDKTLMKDMAYTKNFMSEYSRANGLKASKDEKVRGQYWDTGVKKMLYEREEFKNSTDEESMTFANVTYTPYVNAIEKYMKSAKEMGISADITQSNGRYFIRQKNGDLILQPLTNYFTSQFANDPALQEVYKAQAYVNRKDHVLQNKDKFNGDLVAAERDYLTKQYATIQEYIKLKNEKNTQDADNLEKERDDVKQKLESGNSNEFTPRYLQSLETSLGIAKDNAQYTQGLSEQISDRPSKTPTTSNAAPDLSDIERLRFQVDAGVSSMLAEQDINEAAYNYSRVGMVTDMSADPYGVAAQNHAYALQRQLAAQAHKDQLLIDKDLKEKKNLMIEAGLKNGSYIGMNPVTDDQGNIVDYEPIANPALNNRFTIPGKNKSGGATDKSMSLIQEGKNLTEDFTREYADGMVKQIASTIDSWVKLKRMTREEAAQYFFSDSGLAAVKGKPSSAREAIDQVLLFKPGESWTQTSQRLKDNRAIMTTSQFIANYKKDPANFLTGRGADLLSKTYARVMQFAQATKGDKGVSDSFLEKAPHTDFDKYLVFVRNNELVTQANDKTIQKTLRSTPRVEGMSLELKNKLTNLVLNSDLTMISKEDFVKYGKAYLVNADKYPNITSVIEGKRNLTSADKAAIEALRKKANDKINKPRTEGFIIEKYPSLSERDYYEIERQYIIGKFNLKDNAANEGKADPEAKLKAIYDEMALAYKDVIQNPKEIKSASNLISKNKANAVFNTSESAVGVNLSAIQTTGFKAFLEFTQDASKINFYDTKNNPISFYGPNISGVEQTKELYEDADDMYRNVKIAELLVREYQNGVGKKDFKTFNLSSVQVAVENRNKGAMILYPTLDVLNKLKAGEGKGLLDEETINAIATNGISFVSDRKNFNNWLIKGNELDPLEGMINALGKVEYEDPMGGGNFTIEKDESGAAPYKVYGTMLQMQPDGTKVEVPFVVPPVNFQNNIGLANELARKNLQEMANYNAVVWQQFHAQNYRPGVSKTSLQGRSLPVNQ
jgi:hypothetical protein